MIKKWNYYNFYLKFIEFAVKIYKRGFINE